jgi:2-haloacid dehalogenase
MNIDRRHFLRLSGYAMTALATERSAPTVAPVVRPRVIVFDAFPIFDPRFVKTLIDQVVHDAAVEFYELWRNRIFEYQWLRALSGEYADFEQCAAAALDFATQTLKIDLRASGKRELVAAFSNLKAWDDVDEGLTALAASGVKIGFLSNMTERMLRSNLKRNGLLDRFDFILSTDSVRTFKPDPRAYELPCTALKVEKSEILFVPFAGWDAAGAKWFGFPTYWVNRAHARAELAVRVDGEGADLRGLVQFLQGRDSLAG